MSRKKEYNIYLCTNLFRLKSYLLLTQDKMSFNMLEPVIFVSLGPGEPELITLKGLKVLQQADMVFCPSTVTKNRNISSRAQDILLELGIEKEKIHLFDVPMSKDRSKAIESYKEVSEKIKGCFEKGSRIAVTAEGDAGFYSTIYYISENLHSMDIPVERVAGVPAFIACGTLANIHIVKQEEELNVIPGVTTLETLIEKIEKGASVVIMKPSQCEGIIKEAVSYMKDATFHYFENAGIMDKEFYTSDKPEILSRTFPYFSLLIIRKD